MVNQVLEHQLHLRPPCLTPLTHLKQSFFFTVSGSETEHETDHEPAVEADAECEVDSRQDEQRSKPLQQQRQKSHLEHVRVEHHQQDDDDIEEDGDVLDSVLIKQCRNKIKMNCQEK